MVLLLYKYVCVFFLLSVCSADINSVISPDEYKTFRLNFELLLSFYLSLLGLTHNFASIKLNCTCFRPASFKNIIAAGSE